MGASSDVVILPNCDYAGSFMRAKLLQFHENYRPAYYGTWRKRSSVISARRPWQRDTSFFAYDVDSDEEWEEEEPGESLSHSEVSLQLSCYSNCECTVDQELADALGGSTFLRQMMSWPPSSSHKSDSIS